MRNLNRIVIIGAGAAGLTTAETLRRLGFQGTIMMMHAENTLPYDRQRQKCPVARVPWRADEALTFGPAHLPVAW